MSVSFLGVVQYFLSFLFIFHMHGRMERRCMLEIACAIRYAYTVTCLCMKFWHIFSFGYFLVFGFSAFAFV